MPVAMKHVGAVLLRMLGVAEDSAFSVTVARKAIYVVNTIGVLDERSQVERPDSETPVNATCTHS